MNVICTLNTPDGRSVMVNLALVRLITEDVEGNQCRLHFDGQHSIVVAMAYSLLAEALSAHALN